MYFFQHLRTVSRHRRFVRKYCFRMGLYRQGLTHDLSKYAPVEFREGMRYWQGTRSPNNAAREDKGWSDSWLHHKGRNRHHFEYWIDYDLPGQNRILRGVPMPSRYVGEMVADRMAACRVYLGDEAYSDRSPYDYFMRSKPRLWFVHEQVKDQLEFLLKLLADEGEEVLLPFMRNEFLKKPWEEIKTGERYRRFLETRAATDTEDSVF